MGAGGSTEDSDSFHQGIVDSDYRLAVARRVLCGMLYPSPTAVRSAPVGARSRASVRAAPEGLLVSLISPSPLAPPLVESDAVVARAAGTSPTARSTSGALARPPTRMRGGPRFIQGFPSALEAL